MADKLTYFDGRGAAEVIRLIYAVAGKDFKDNRVAGESWQALRPKTPMKALPVLETNGKMFCQSGAIARYLAKKFGLFGSSNEEALAIDEVYESVQDIVREIYKFMFEKDEAKKAEAKKKFTDEILPKLNEYIENRSGGGKNKFIVGDKLTLADLALFVLVDNTTLGGNGEWWEKYSYIKNHRDSVASDSKIKAWLEKRPKTQF